MTVQGKTEGRHPGSSLPPIYTTLKGSHKKTANEVCAALSGQFRYRVECHHHIKRRVTI